MATGGWRSRALWRTRPYLAPYHRHITFIVISSIVSSAGMVAVPLIVKEVIDGPLADGDRGGIVKLGRAHGGHRRRRGLPRLRPTDPAHPRLHRVGDEHAQRPLRPAAAPRRRVPRPLAVRPAPVPRHDRSQRHTAVRRLRGHLLHPHRRAGAGDLRGPPRAPPLPRSGRVRRHDPGPHPLPPVRAAVHGGRPAHPGPDRRPHDDDRGGRQGHPRPEGVRAGRRGLRRLPGPGADDPRHPDGAHHAPHAVRVGPRAHPQPHADPRPARGGAGRGLGRAHPRRPGRLRRPTS